MTAVELDGSAPWPHVVAAVAGAAMPQIGSSVRARWTFLVTDKQSLHTPSRSRQSSTSCLHHRPALVTLLATGIHPLAGLSSAVLATVAGTAALTRQKRTEPPPSESGDGGAPVGPMPWGYSRP
jgi:hypothetical protein